MEKIEWSLEAVTRMGALEREALVKLLNKVNDIADWITTQEGGEE